VKETPEQRSRTMRAVQSRNTGPELSARQLLRSLGYVGYRIHRKELPGKPDICFIGRKKALFVHGCFWHGHKCRHGSNKPKSNQSYWLSKIERNEARDKANQAKLVKLGWSVLTIWECDLAKPDELSDKLAAFLQGQLSF
jgi:DNA mismatch endonuclease (patch repair protein)